MTRGKKFELLLWVILAGLISYFLLFFTPVRDIFNIALFRGETPTECSSLVRYSPSTLKKNAVTWDTHIVLVRDFNVKFIDPNTGAIEQLDTKLNQDEAIHFCNGYRDFMDSVSEVTDGSLRVQVDKVIDYRDRVSSVLSVTAEAARKDKNLEKVLLTPSDLGYPENPQLSFPSGTIDNIFIAYNAGSLKKYKNVRIGGATHTSSVFRDTKKAVPVTIMLDRQDLYSNANIGGLLLHEFTHSIEFLLLSAKKNIESFHTFLIANGYANDQRNINLFKSYFKNVIEKATTYEGIPSATPNTEGNTHAENITYTHENNKVTTEFDVKNPWSTTIKKITATLIDKGSNAVISRKVLTDENTLKSSHIQVTFDNEVPNGNYTVSVAVVDSDRSDLVYMEATEDVFVGVPVERKVTLLEPERFAPNIIEITNVDLTERSLEANFLGFIPDSYVKNSKIPLKVEIVRDNKIVQSKLYFHEDIRSGHPIEHLEGTVTLDGLQLSPGSYSVKIYVHEPTNASSWFNYAESESIDIQDGNEIPEITSTKPASPLLSDQSNFAFDVSTDHPSYQDILVLHNHTFGKELMGGNPDGSFKADQNINRAEITKIAALIAEKFQDTTSSTTTTSFKDVASNAWFAEFVAYAYTQGIISGYKDSSGNLTGYFGPGDLVTRAQSLKILLNAFEVKTNSTPTALGFFDVSTQDWYFEFIRTAKDIGLLSHNAISGNILYNNQQKSADCATCFSPNMPITRGEVATLLVRLLEYTDLEN